MTTLAIDIGSSSVKAGIVRGRGILGEVARASFHTHIDGAQAEVDADDVMRAVARAVRRLGRAARTVDVIAIDAMGPSWVAMDRRGRAISPIITHQDRRSVAEAMEIERRIGKSRHLKLAGNRPIPGGISSTTALWFSRHARGVRRRVDLVGHLTTFLHRQLTGARVIDPSHAAFMGLFRTITLGGWDDELCAAADVERSWLPEVRDAAEVGGRVTPEAAGRLGVPAGAPVLVGILDGSGAMLAAGVRRGQAVNVMGSTDVLAVCTDQPTPDARVLTRPLGTGRWWVQVATLASAATTLKWLRQTLFAEMDEPRFAAHVRRASRRDPGAVTFVPRLAGDRHSIEPSVASFSGLTLSTTREDLLAAAVDALARASAERWDVLRSLGVRPSGPILLSGGLSGTFRRVLHRDWPAGLRFRQMHEATLRGVAMLSDRSPRS